MPTWRLVVCSQNHDQIGNRAVGDRITEALDDDQLACAALLTLAGPFTPMLFQGEEWAASTPFQFFTSHPEPELGRATAEGRIKEFERMGWDPAVVPDPQDPGDYERSKLDWSELEHRPARPDARRLPAARPAAPHGPGADRPVVRLSRLHRRRGAGLFRMRRGDVEVVVNFGDETAVVDPAGRTELLFATGDDVRLAGELDPAGTRRASLLGPRGLDAAPRPRLVPAVPLPPAGSGPGAHQFQRPSSFIVAGTSSARTTVASMSSATSMPMPIIFMNTMPDRPNAPITTASSSAALVMIRPVFWTPVATARSLSSVRSHCSRTRESRNTS